HGRGARGGVRGDRPEDPRRRRLRFEPRMGRSPRRPLSGSRVRAARRGRGGVRRRSRSTFVRRALPRRGLRASDRRRQRGHRVGSRLREPHPRSHLHGEGVRLGALAGARSPGETRALLAYPLERSDGAAPGGGPRGGRASPPPPPPPRRRAGEGGEEEGKRVRGGGCGAGKKGKKTPSSLPPLSFL